MDVPDGTYEAPLNVKLTAVSNLPGATVVYTLDGSTPTADSPYIESGTTLHLESACTLTAGILSEGKVYGIQQREYQVFKPHDITLYVRSDVSSWGGMYFYVWDNNDKQLSGNWPGKRVTTTQSILGKRWYYQTYRITSPDGYINLVVSQTTGSKQTVDITGLRTDSYLCITSSQEGGKYIVEDQTSDIETGIWETHNSQFIIQNDAIYDLSGRQIRNGKLSKGIIIDKGRKIAY